MIAFYDFGVASGDLSAGVLNKTGTQAATSSFTQLTMDAELFTSGWRTGGNPNDAKVPATGVSLARPSFQVSNDTNTTKLEGEVLKGGSSYFGLPYASTSSTGAVSVNGVGAFVSAAAGNLFGLYGRSALNVGNYDSSSWLCVEKIDPATNYALVGKNANQSCTSNTNVTLTWQTETVDTLGFHDTSSNTSRLSVHSSVTTNLVRITTNVASPGSANGAALSLSMNGGAGGGAPGLPIRDQEHGGAIFLNLCSAILEVTPGTDYFEIVFRSSGTTVNVGSADYNWAQIEEVQPCSRALAYRTGTLALSAATNTHVPLQATTYDNDSWFSSGDFVVPAGVSYVRVCFAIEGASQTGDLIGRIEINGASPAGTGRSDNDTVGADFVSGVTGILPVSPGDVITLVAYSTNARNITANTWMSVEEVTVSAL